METARKKYQRTVPAGCTRLVTVNIQGRRIEDVVAALTPFVNRTSSGGDDARCRVYADCDGNLVVAAGRYV